MFRLVLCALVVVAVTAGSWVARQQAVAADVTWPERELVIDERSQWTAAVRLAVEQWNRAQVGIGMRWARPGERADVRVVTDRRRARRHCANVKGPCEAFVTRLGWKGGDRVDVVLPSSLMGHAERHPTDTQVRLVVHELGYVLGLRHRRQACSVMQRNVGLEDCVSWQRRARERDVRFCGPLPADVRRAARMYGGPGRSAPLCAPGR